MQCADIGTFIAVLMTVEACQEDEVSLTPGRRGVLDD
jgi:hypothetical protein